VPRKHVVWTIICGAVTWVVGASIFYRTVFVSRFELMSGDDGDARLQQIIAEHWYRALQGKVHVLDMPGYFPYARDLGYTDTLFAYIPVFVVWRLIGADMFIAYQMTIITLNALGFATFLVLAVKYLELKPVVALVGAAAFAFANNYFIKAGHTQFVSIYFLPILAILFVETALALNRQSRRAIWTGAAFSAGLGVLAFTAFYVGWFLSFFLCIFAVVFVVTSWRQLTGWAANRVRLLVLTAVSSAGAFLISIVPLLWVYLPVMLIEGRHRPYSAVWRKAPIPTDVVNVGVDNAMWSAFLLNVVGLSEQRLRNGEIGLAVTPLVTVLMIVGLAIAWRRCRQHSPDANPRTGFPHGRERLILAAGLSTWVVVVLAMRFGDVHGWYLVHHIVPGAGALREAGRYWLVHGFFAIVIAAYALDSLFSSARRRGSSTGMIAIGLVCLLVLVEQLNLRNNTRYSRSAEQKFLARVEATEFPCKVFFIAVPQPNRNKSYSVQLDAMLMAQTFGLNTINGFSGWAPPGWKFLRTKEPEYHERALAWAERHRIDDLCAYDAATHVWTPVSE